MTISMLNSPHCLHLFTFPLFHFIALSSPLAAPALTHSQSPICSPLPPAPSARRSPLFGDPPPLSLPDLRPGQERLTALSLSERLLQERDALLGQLTGLERVSQEWDRSIRSGNRSVRNGNRSGGGGQVGIRMGFSQDQARKRIGQSREQFRDLV